MGHRAERGGAQWSEIFLWKAKAVSGFASSSKLPAITFKSQNVAPGRDQNFSSPFKKDFEAGPGMLSNGLFLTTLLTSRRKAQRRTPTRREAMGRERGMGKIISVICLAVNLYALPFSPMCLIRLI